MQQQPETPVQRLASVFQGKAKMLYIGGSVLWLAALLYFWNWWLQPQHHTYRFGSVITTAVLAWITFVPAYFMVIFYRAKVPAGPLEQPVVGRVAMVVTKAPSEPFAVVQRTLTAMLSQNGAQDTWLADEDPTAETIAWCKAHGVQISTRKGVEEYHRSTWPRRTRCKEGNLAYFYDKYGYERYDFVVQLDADHIPEQNYLLQMLRPFADPAIGYVSAPSICDSNAEESWSARGRLYAEASMHGSLQAGYSNGLAPLCIGSHYAVRTKALKEIGGLGPELAEDHSTTLFMNAHGWRGVHALDAIAHGDGPRTFADLVTQEFQWSRSLVMLLLQYTPKMLGGLPLRLKFQFLFSQLWYPLFAGFMVLMFLMPVIALVGGHPLVAVTYPDFLSHFMPLSIVLILLAFGWRKSGTFRPVNAPIISWEATLFLFARWPWALLGTVAAVRDWLTGSFVDFRVTPKGNSVVDPLPFRVLFPYALLFVMSVLPVLLIDNAGESRGFYIFGILNAIIYGALLVVIVIQHARENTVRMNSVVYKPAMAIGLLTIVALPVAATFERGMSGLQAVAWGTRSFELFETRFSATGAGMNAERAQTIVFQPKWLPETTAE